MAIIKSGSGSELLAVAPVSLAAHARLMEDTLTPLAKLSGDAFLATSRSLVGSGLEPTTGKVRPFAVDHTGRARGGDFAMLFQDLQLGNTTINNLLWQQLLTTQTMTQTVQGGIVFNAGNITTINTGSALKSYKRFRKAPGISLVMRWVARINKVANSVVEMGLADGGAGFGGTPTAVLDQTLGFYFRFSSAGTVVPVITYNSVDAISGTSIVGLTTTDTYEYTVYLDDGSARFLIVDRNGLIVADQTLKIGVTQNRELSQATVSAFIGVRNSAVAPASAPQLVLGAVSVGVLGIDLDQPYGHLQGSLQRSSNILPGSTLTPINHVNSTVPGAATLSNTAASYVTLGGKFLFAAFAGSEVDNNLFKFQNIDSGSGGLTFYCTGVVIDTTVQVAAVATTPTQLEWSINTGLVASLADPSTRQLPLGVQSFVVGALAGTTAQQLNVQFGDMAIPCEPGKHIGFSFRQPVGTATATQTFRGSVTPVGYWA